MTKHSKKWQKNDKKTKKKEILTNYASDSTELSIRTFPL
jgi:hypothetical protein